MEPQRIDFDVTFTDGTTSRVTVEERVFPGERSQYATPGAPPALSPERAASKWAAHQLALRSEGGDFATGIASIRRVDVRREWSFMEARDMSAWRALVLAAVDAGVVIRGEWDEGNGLSPWYVANPSAAERALYAACCAALTPKDSPVDDAELIEMEERANANIDDDDPAVRAIARDSNRLGYEVLRLRNEVFLAQRKLGEKDAEIAAVLPADRSILRDAWAAMLRRHQGMAAAQGRKDGVWITASPERRTVAAEEMADLIDARDPLGEEYLREMLSSMLSIRVLRDASMREALGAKEGESTHAAAQRVAAERDALRAIIEGSPNAPTDADLAAHAGPWLVRRVDGYLAVLDADDARRAARSAAPRTVRWWPLRADGCLRTQCDDGDET